MVLCLCVVSCAGKTVQTADPGDAAPDTVVSVDEGLPPGAGARPPPRPSTVASGVTKWFAIDHVRLGLSNPTGALRPDAWKDYGYDLDARNTTADQSVTSTNSCKRRSGSMSKVLMDGNDGRDDNFGQHVMAVIKSLAADVEDRNNSPILKGSSTLLLRLDNFGPDDNGAVPGALFVSGSLAGPPTFTTSDVWPIDVASVAPSGEAKMLFPKGYMSKGIWVSGEVGTTTMQLMLRLGGFPTTLPLESAVISVRVADGSDGVIAGAADTAKMKDAITPWLHNMGICPGNPTYDQVVETLAQSADLVSGAPLMQDTTKECNAISLGFAFTMKPTGVPTVRTGGPPPPPSECP